MNMDGNRGEFVRQQVALSEKNAATARSGEMKRAWLICAREWRQIARADELKHLDGILAGTRAPAAGGLHDDVI